MRPWCDAMWLHIAMLWFIHCNTAIRIAISQRCDVFHCEAPRYKSIQKEWCDSFMLIHCDEIRSWITWFREWITSQWFMNESLQCRYNLIHLSQSFIHAWLRSCDSFTESCDLFTDHLWYMNESHCAMWFIRSDTLQRDSFMNHCDVIHSRNHVVHSWMSHIGSMSFIHGDALRNHDTRCNTWRDTHCNTSMMHCNTSRATHCNTSRHLRDITTTENHVTYPTEMSQSTNVHESCHIRMSQVT